MALEWPVELAESDCGTVETGWGPGLVGVVAVGRGRPLLGRQPGRAARQSGTRLDDVRGWSPERQGELGDLGTVRQVFLCQPPLLADVSKPGADRVRGVDHAALPLGDASS